MPVEATCASGGYMRQWRFLCQGRQPVPVKPSVPVEVLVSVDATCASGG